MTRENFIKKLESYQTSSAPFEVKQKAISRLKEEFYGFDDAQKMKQVLTDICLSSAELRPSELF
jgi:hypothetical protein